MHNLTLLEFRLVGFRSLQKFKLIFFTTILMFYVVTVIGNLLIIILVSINQHLKTPMYFFLSQLSLCDILITTNIAPKILDIILRRDTISIAGCLTQFYFFCGSLGTECLLLTVMSFDRYLAICNPLRYHSIMTLKRCLHFVIWCWFLGFTLSLNLTLLLNRLDYCSSDEIDNFFCDFTPILELSCSDTSFVEIEDLVLCFPFGICPLVFIFGTYVRIALTVVKIPSTSGRIKAFSTCSSHLSVVFMYYGTILIIYVIPSGGTLKHINKLLSLLCTVMTPLFNPIIYSLRNQDIKDCLRITFKPRF